MIVRCGRCRAELEVAGSGEFLCPACGTRNVVRGGGRPADPYAVGGNVSGLTVPGGMPATGAPPATDTTPANWGRCPSCSHRFAMGEVDKVTCPNCRAELQRAEGGELELVSG